MFCQSFVARTAKRSKASKSPNPEAPAQLVVQHQNPAKMRTVLALLSHGYLPYSVASDSKLLETSRGLGTGGPAASRHRGQQRARGGASVERALLDAVSVHKVLGTLI